MKLNDFNDVFFFFTEKYIKSKILMAILAIVVIVKLIKLKLFVFLPLLMGVHNAKKLFLKFILFVFPALTHIFKLCSWYHNNYHSTKYHHHHHQISHLHHTVSILECVEVCHPKIMYIINVPYVTTIIGKMHNNRLANGRFLRKSVFFIYH